MLELYSLMISTKKKSSIIAQMGLSSKDTGSAHVQVGILTERIKEITAHLGNNKHDFMARRGLLQMVGKRRRLLRYVASKNSDVYLSLIKELGIRK